MASKGRKHESFSAVFETVGLKPFFKDLLGLFGVYTIEDLSIINDEFVLGMQQKIRSNGLIGVGADFQILKHQHQFLGRSVGFEFLDKFEFTLLDRVKLGTKLASEAKKIEGEAAEAKKKQLMNEQARKAERYKSSSSGSANSACLTEKGSLVSSLDEAGSSIQLDSGNGAHEQCTLEEKRNITDDLLNIAGALSIKTVNKINEYWKMTNYKGPKMQLIDVHSTVKDEKIFSKAKCLVCNEYIVLSVITNSAVSIYNYKSHAAKKHVSTDVNGKIYLKEDKQQKISNFFKKN